MKKSALILMSMAAMFGLSSCDKELVPAENTNNRFTIHATTESGTKTALSWNDENKNYDVVWSEGDQFAIYNNSAGNTYTKVLFSSEFTLESGEGTPNGSFTGSAQLNTGIEYMALYPASIYSKSYNKTKWPATTQTYTAGKITNSPMFATFTVNEKDQIPTVSFKNMGGILRLTVKNTESVSISKITVCADELESPITLDCSNGGSGVALTADGVEFNIAMPSNGNEPESYSNVSIYLTDTNGKVCCKSPKATTLNIVRSQITKATFSVNSKDFYSYTTGSKVTIHGHEGIVVEIDGDKVIVATMNVGATTVNEDDCLGDKMKYDEACAAWSGWRLPTVGELTAFCDPGYPACGDTYGAAGCNGAVMWYIDGDEEIDLYLPLNDYEFDGENYFPSDKYWTGTPGGDGTYYYFAPAIEFDGDYAPLGLDYIRKEPADKNDTYLVRLFHDLP